MSFCRNRTWNNQQWKEFEIADSEKRRKKIQRFHTALELESDGRVFAGTDTTRNENLSHDKIMKWLHLQFRFTSRFQSCLLCLQTVLKWNPYIYFTALHRQESVLKRENFSSANFPNFSSANLPNGCSPNFTSFATVALSSNGALMYRVSSLRWQPWPYRATWT